MNKKENIFKQLKNIFKDSQSNLTDEYFRYLDNNILDDLIEYLFREVKKGNSKIKIQIPCPEEFVGIMCPVSKLLEYLKLKLSIPEGEHIVYYKTYYPYNESSQCVYNFFLYLN